jgi:hypothetical protein
MWKVRHGGVDWIELSCLIMEPNGRTQWKTFGLRINSKILDQEMHSMSHKRLYHKVYYVVLWINQNWNHKEFRSMYSDWLRVGLPERGPTSSPDKVKIFQFSMPSRPAMGSTHSPNKGVTWVLSQGVRRPGREVHQSSRTSAHVKKTWP